VTIDRTAGPLGADDERQSVIDRFHRLYYDIGESEGGTWKRTTYFGIETWKCPFDTWIYQEILFEVRPQLIVETGTHLGGSALWFAHQFDLLGGAGQVVTVDVQPHPGKPEHPRIAYHHGSSLGDDFFDLVSSRAAGLDRVMVVLDSDHTCDHVAAELERFAPLVSPGCHLVVEDSNINGHPIYPGFGPGPMEAIEGFLPAHPEFTVDRDREKLLMTFNPNGFLRRRSDLP
jgi:cephalosporin hydroxylase